MRRTLAGTFGVWLLASVALAAADFWEEKDFTTWSDKEVEKMLNDSPWSQGVRIAVGSLSEAPEFRMPQGNIPAPPDCGGGQFDRIQRFKVTLTWSSALPIRQAQVRLAIGRDAPIPPESQAALEQEQSFYAVTMHGLPPRFAFLATMGDALKAGAMLKRKDAQPIAPEDVRLFRVAADQSLQLVFLFPRTDPVTLDHEEVEFVAGLGVTDLKKKFKLEDMVYGGGLEL